MALYVADTHALVWYWTKSPQLSPHVLSIFRESVNGLHTIVIPAIVLAEVMDITEKKRVPLSFRSLLARLEKGANFAIFPLTTEIIRTAATIKLRGELHDRLIVATAKWLDANVLSKDERIKEGGIVPVIW